MSNSSEMKKETEDLIHLGYPHGQVEKEYYTARATDTMGVVVSYMVGGVAMIQFFPWAAGEGTGHQRYAQFITDRASQVMASKGELFVKYPFITAPATDLLMIKCLIENAIEEMKNVDNQ
jgi:hypothetical protein